jgi:hypothetical protein
MLNVLGQINLQYNTKKFLNKTKFEDLNYFIFQGDIEK